MPQQSHLLGLGGAVLWASLSVRYTRFDTPYSGDHTSGQVLTIGGVSIELTIMFSHRSANPSALLPIGSIFPSAAIGIRVVVLSGLYSGELKKELEVICMVGVALVLEFVMNKAGCEQQKGLSWAMIIHRFAAPADPCGK